MGATSLRRRVARLGRVRKVTGPGDDRRPKGCGKKGCGKSKKGDRDGKGKKGGRPHRSKDERTMEARSPKAP